MHHSIAAAKANLLQYVPTAEELAATPHRYGQIFEEPETLQQEFPFADIARPVAYAFTCWGGALYLWAGVLYLSQVVVAVRRAWH